MSTARYLIGDVFDRMAELPDGSVDLVVTSPPFLALRSYLPADHPDKAKEIGSEPTPAAFLDTLLALSAEWRRVLAPHGSICVELGDTYAGNNSTGWHRAGDEDPDRYRSLDAVCAPSPKDGNGWPLDKSLSGIPTLYAWSLAYGRNLLNPATTCDPWRIRNMLVWARPNPPVGALGDKWRPATSYVTVACVGRQRYFDLDAVRVPTLDPRESRAVGRASASKGVSGGDSGNPDKERLTHNPAGAPPLDWCDERDLAWQPLMPLPTQPYAGSHYATFPTQLPKRLIECMSPQRVCTLCGKPSERITSSPEYVRNGETCAPDVANFTGLQGRRAAAGHSIRTSETLGWTDCGHDQWRFGHILDPFGGSGTTAVAATGLGRDCTLIDIDARNADLASERVGMFLEVHA